jgi:proteasome activator subunit 4
MRNNSNNDFFFLSIDSCVNIGLKDNLNKGLGYELVNCYDESHEYNNLSRENSEILLKKRESLIEFILKLAEKLIQMQTSETTLLILCSRILSLSSITYGLFVNDFEKMWKAHCQSRSSMQNKLLGKKNSLRDELIQRVMLQYKFRSFHVHTVLNEVDLKVIEMLFKLSIDSIYSNVRKDSQTQLFSILSHFPYSSLLIVPKIVNLLKKAEKNELTHDQLKGCLYLVRGNGMQETMTIKQNWEVISALWPILFKFQQFEKPSVQALLDKIYLKTNKDYDSFDNRIKLSDDLVDNGYQMNSVLTVEYSKNDGKRLKRFRERLEKDNSIISSLMNEMTKIASDSQLLWKNQPTIFGSVLFLLNACEIEKSLLTVECVQLYVDSLINENINVRRVSENLNNILI